MRKFINRQRTTMLESWGIANGSGLIVGSVCSEFGRFMVS